MRSALGSWKSLGSVTASTAISAALTLVVTLVAVALLEKAEFGHFVFFLAVSTLVGSFLDLGVSLQMMMEYSRGPIPERESRVARCWSAQLWSYGCGAVLAIALSIPVGRYFAVPASMIVLGALSGALAGLFNFVISVLQVRQQWRARAQVIVRQAASRAPATLVGLAFGSATSGAIGAVIGTALGLTLALRHAELASVRSSFRHVTGVAGAWRTWLSSRWFALLIVAASTAEYAPIAFVGRVAGAEPLAVFGLAVQLAAGPALAMQSLIVFLLPSGTDPTVPIRDYATLMRRSMLPALALFALAAITAPFLIPAIFGREFAAAVAPFELLLVATAAFAAANPLQILHLRLGAARTWAVMDVVRVLTLAGGLIVFSRWFSVPIAAGCAVAFSAVVSRIVGFIALARNRDRLMMPGPDREPTGNDV